MTATSGRVVARLAELGVALPPVATPLAAYVPAVRDGDLVWTSGQLPVVDGEIAVTGLVGDGDGQVGRDQALAAARLCGLNALAAVASVVDLDDVVRVVKVVGFVASTPAFTGQPAVVDGVSTLLGDVFGEAGVHARSAVGVSALPKGAPVEVELTVRVR